MWQRDGRVDHNIESFIVRLEKLIFTARSTDQFNELDRCGRQALAIAGFGREACRLSRQHRAPWIREERL